jgi:uncharacterized protein YjiK
VRAAVAGIAMAALIACSGSPAQARKQHESPFGEGARVANPGVREPSGIVFDTRLGHLFVVGDEGTLAELDGQGRFLRADAVGGDLEDVTVYEPSGDLVLVDEKKAALIVYDPAQRAVKSRWRLDADAIVGKREGGREGFEGVGFRPQAGRPGGGVFYLTHQRGPAMLVAIAFDPAGAPHTLGAEAVVGRWGLPGHQDLTAVSWSPALGRLLVLADTEDELLVVDPEQSGASAVQAQLRIPGLNQEGVCLDPAGNLWIADDRGASVVRYAGARPIVEGYSRLVK